MNNPDILVRACDGINVDFTAPDAVLAAIHQLSADAQASLLQAFAPIELKLADDPLEPRAVVNTVPQARLPVFHRQLMRYRLHAHGVDADTQADCRYTTAVAPHDIVRCQSPSGDPLLVEVVGLCPDGQQAWVMDAEATVMTVDAGAVECLCFRHERSAEDDMVRMWDVNYQRAVRYRFAPLPALQDDQTNWRNADVYPDAALLHQQWAAWSPDEQAYCLGRVTRPLAIQALNVSDGPGLIDALDGPGRKELAWTLLKFAACRRRYLDAHMNGERVRRDGFRIGDIVAIPACFGADDAQLVEVVGFPGGNSDLVVMDQSGRCRKEITDWVRMICPVEDRQPEDDLVDHLGEHQDDRLPELPKPTWRP